MRGVSRASCQTDLTLLDVSNSITPIPTLPIVRDWIFGKISISWAILVFRHLWSLFAKSASPGRFEATPTSTHTWNKIVPSHVDLFDTTCVVV